MIITFTKTLFLLSILALLSLVNGCGPKEDEMYEEPIDSTFLEYVYFKKGTWWVYQDTVTKQRDSQYVTHNDIVKLKETDPDIVQIYLADVVYLTRSQMEIKTMNHSISYSGGNRCGRLGLDYQSNSCYIAWYEKKYGQGEGPEDCAYFVFQPIIGEEYSYTTHSTVTDSYDSFRVASIYFPSVYRVSIGENLQENGKQTQFLISKNHGIIRKAIKTDDTSTYPSGWQVWDLVNFNIVQ